MCGILLSLILREVEEPVLEKVHKTQLWSTLVKDIQDRGPSSYSTVKCIVSGNNHLTLSSSVLSLRNPFTKQPVVDSECNKYLQFNGELYNDELFEEDDKNHNDTQYMYDLLANNDGSNIINVLQKLRGEYAFSYYDKLNENIWFGRDCIGRRSLLYSFDEDVGLFITSVVPDQRVLQREKHNIITPLVKRLEEVPSDTIFCLNLASKKITKFPWEYSTENKKSLFYPYSRVTRCIDEEDDTYNTGTAHISLQDLLEESISRRVKNIPEPKNVHLDDSSPHLAILFSGGIDCTLLALLVDKVLPSNIEVDLLNVSFENKRTGGKYDTPDRKLGRRSWKELYDRREATSIPFRFRFIEINVPFDEMLEHRPKVQSLMWPKDTVMDLSIAIAFYFASRGKGQCMKISPETNLPYLSNDNYESKAPVLLSGLGADELFGGYTRHTTRLRQKGYKLLAEELQLDFSRLHERNLGRDDRVCATWGKEVRYPFLDESVVDWAMKCPLRLKVYYPKIHTDAGSNGDNYDESKMQTKYILRLIARSNSLPLVSEEKKRAIQFGAKTAKMDIGDGKSRGTDKLAIV